MTDSTPPRPLPEKIAADLRRAGFFSEMVSIQHFLDADWQVRGAPGYLDHDSDRYREHDLLAETFRYRLEDSLPSVMCQLKVVGEVKHSASPWVVFRQPPDRSRLSIESFCGLSYSPNVPPDRNRLSQVIDDTSLLSELGWQAYGVHEAFKDPNNPSSWYSAFVSACKAAEAAFNAEKSLLDPLASSLVRSFYFTWFQPLVILDGLLFSATLTPTHDVAITPCDAATFRYSYRTSRYAREHYHLDLVTLPFLPRYISLQKRRIESLFTEALGQSEALPSSPAT